MSTLPARAPGAVGAILTLTLALPVLAQGGAPDSVSASQTVRATAGVPAQSRRPTWKARRTVEVVSEYDDNVFLLSDSRKPDLSPPSIAATASGRYLGMPNAGDVITTLNMSVAFRGPGIGGRTLAIRPEAGLAYYAQNADRRNLALGLALEQALPHRRQLKIAATTTPSYFARNYLADAVDSNGDGTIAADERRYRHGTYRETSLDLEYRMRLDKSSKKSPFGADLELGGGWYARSYEAPFHGRDVNGPVLNAGLLLTVSRTLDVDVRYRLEALSATPTPQVMVLDETDVGRDLNGNGSTAEQNVRTVSIMDRSRNEHAVRARGTFAVGKRGKLELDVDRRWRLFSSEQPLDLANYNRRDVRNSGGIEFNYAIGPDMRLSARGELASQRLRRGGDAGLGEIDDYTRRRLSLAVRYEF